jgi:hypothetical protein
MDYQGIMEEWNVLKIEIDDIEIDKIKLFLKAIYLKYQSLYLYVLNLCKMIVSDYFTQNDYKELLLMSKDAPFFAALTPFGVPIFEDFKGNLEKALPTLEKIMTE